MSNNQRMRSPKTLPIVHDWQREQMTLSKSLGIDINAQREFLKDALLHFEEANKGFNLVGSKVYEFLRHVQNIVWKQLAEMKRENPGEYAAWMAGERGYWPLETNNTSHGMLLRLSESRRMEIDSALPGEAPSFGGHSKSDDNIRRTVLNWRKKTTETWVCNDGATVKGFPFFMGWKRLNRTGAPDPKGRGNVVGLVNLRWIFGPEWPDAQKIQNADNQEFTKTDTENFSTIPHVLKTANTFQVLEKKEEEKVFPTVTSDFLSKTAEPSNPIETARKQGNGKSGSASVQENIFEKNSAAAPAAAGPGAIERALELWKYMLTMLYFPYFGTGKIRFNAQTPWMGTQIGHYNEEKCLELMIQNIHAAVDTGEITLANACARLKIAIEKQAKYMQDNPDVWIAKPDKFLAIGKYAGTLQSAVQVFLPREVVKNNVLTVENDGFKARKNRLYAQLIEQGATTHPGTFASWAKAHGLDHLEACINYLMQQAARRRATGKHAGKEFDSRQGGVTAYFAGLVSRLDSKVIAEETRQIQRDKQKKQLWDIADRIQAERKAEAMSPDSEARYDELCQLYQQLCEDQDFCDLAVDETQRYFGMQISTLKRLSNLILINFILKNGNTNEQNDEAAQ